MTNLSERPGKINPAGPGATGAAELRLQSALDLARLGFGIVRAKGKRAYPDGWNTTALLRDPARVETSHTLVPEDNTGAVPPEGACIIDVDNKQQEDGRSYVGMASVSRLNGGEQLDSPITCLTGSGNQSAHYYFRCDHVRVLKRHPAGDGEGIELIKPGKHMGLIAGSIHPVTGNMYRWQEGCCPDFVISLDALPMAPDWVYEQAQKTAEPQAHVNGERIADRIDRDRARGNSNKRITAYCLKVLDDEATALAAARGNRNDGLNNAAVKIGHWHHYGVFSEGDAFARLRDASISNGYYTSALPGDGPAAFEATFNSGWAKGISEPKEIPENGGQRAHSQSRAAGSSGASDKTDDHDPRDDDETAAPIEPEPLIRPIRAAQPYPVDVLPAILAEAVRAIVDKVQVPPALAAQSVMAVASLACQGVADIRLPTGQRVPISNDFITIAETGARKSASDALAMHGVVERETTLRGLYELDLEDYERDAEAYKIARGEILHDKNTKGNRSAKNAALAKLGAAPEPPLFPALTIGDPTLEGLHKAMVNGHASLGIFSSEGGALLGGFAFSEDHLLKTSAGLSSLWDGTVVKRVRVTGDNSILAGRRVSLHLQIQPGVSDRLFGSEVCRDQGILSRVLAVAPESIAGTRLWREPAEGSQDAVNAFNERVSRLLARHLRMVEGKRNELNPEVLQLSPEARGLWCEFADQVEREIRPGGSLEAVRGLANKLPEHATRLAAVLTVFCQPTPREVSAHTLASGIALAEHYALEAIRIYEAGKIGGDLALAQSVLDWLLGAWPERQVSLPDLYQRGPCTAIRDKAMAAKVAGILESHGHLLKLKRGATIAGQKRREAWAIVGKGAA